MANFKKILVAVDFSPISAAALRTAVNLSRQLGSRLKIVHAVSMQMAGLPMEGGLVYADPELFQQQVDAARQELARFIAENAADASGCESEVLSGFPSDEINRAANEGGADLIVMGTHGRTGLRHLFMGSVAESVLKGAKVPVLCVKD